MIKLPFSMGPYTLLHPLGEGGLASVYLGAKDKKTYAIKVLKFDRLGEASAVINFVREARIGQKMKHPSFTRVVDHGKVSIQGSDDVYFIVMDLILGVNVQEMLTYFESSDQAMPLPMKLYILKQACQSLRYLHASTVFEYSDSYLFHGDISPSNLMLSEQGIFKLMDLGSANQESTVEMAKHHFGKLQYLPPEFYEDHAVAQKIDLYSLAVVAYQIFFHDMPFKGKNKDELVQNIKEASLPSFDSSGIVANEKAEKALKVFFQTSLNKDPLQRYKNVKEFEKSLFLIEFKEPIITSFTEASVFLRKHFASKLREIDQSWCDQFARFHSSGHAKYYGDATATVTPLVLPTDQRRHPRVSLDQRYPVSAEIQLPDKKFPSSMKVLQLSQGGLLAEWKLPKVERGVQLPGALYYNGKKVPLQMHALYYYKSKGKIFYGFRFEDIKEVEVKNIRKYVDRIISENTLEEDKVLTQEHKRHLHIYYSSEEMLKKEIQNNILKGRSLIISPYEFPQNTQVILHVNLDKTFRKLVIPAKVVACYKDPKHKGFQIET
ncbi:MAG: protein kinase, partial [Bdellovibrionales bacterium]|nr:protein kinase [Bdellovibrionales bacterium]